MTGILSVLKLFQAGKLGANHFGECTMGGVQHLRQRQHDHGTIESPHASITKISLMLICAPETGAQATATAGPATRDYGLRRVPGARDLARRTSGLFCWPS